MDFWKTLFRLASRMEQAAPQLATRLMLAAARRNSEPEVHLVPLLADRKRVSIDVGANWGLYTGTLLPLSRQVIGVEPNPMMASKLRRAFPAARIEQCALGAGPGTAELYIPIQANGAVLHGWASLERASLERTIHETVESIAVPIRRLDDLGLSNVGFIKIDVERFEMQVLDGAIETIARDRPNLMIECSYPDPLPLIERMAGMGYDAGFCLDGKLAPFSEWRSDLVGWTKSAPNNFIFRPR